MSTVPDELVNRVRELERQTRWLRQVGAVSAFAVTISIGVVGAVALTASATRPVPAAAIPRSLDLDSLTIRDAKGVVRVTLGTDQRGGHIGLSDERGAERVTLNASADSSGVTINRQVILISTDKGAGFYLNDWKGEQPIMRAMLGCFEDRAPRLLMMGRKGKGGVSLYMDDADQQFLQLRDENDTVRAGLALIKNLGPGFALFDEKGKQIR